MRITGHRLLSAVCLAGSLTAAARAGEALPSSAVADLRRGIASTGIKTSDAPALRLEPAPSSAFRLGAALAAWTNATEALEYDLKTPSGDGDDAETILGDCYDEAAAFADLESARRALHLQPTRVVDAAGLVDPALGGRWNDRLRQAPLACPSHRRAG